MYIPFLTLMSLSTHLLHLCGGQEIHSFELRLMLAWL